MKNNNYPISVIIMNNFVYNFVSSIKSRYISLLEAKIANLMCQLDLVKDA